MGRVELGAKNEDVNNFLDGQPAAGLGVFQLPGSNALETAERVKAKMDELSQRFPEDVAYHMYYDTTPYISESIHEVFNTLRDAVILVAIVVLVFLQNWRSALIPLVAVPVAIIGTFAAMALMGFSINTLSMFGLVLAIGIVVDDAIVVVEATEHHIEQGMKPRAAAHQAMAEVSAPVIAIGLVLACVFVPCVFITGIPGRFFRQFALTIAVSTVLSAFNSLTLSPALCAILLKERHAHSDPLSRLLNFLLGWFFRLFNAVFAVSTAWYLRAVGRMLRLSALVLVVYGGLLYLTGWSFKQVPTGFIPDQDQGYLFVAVQLPDATSLERTDAAMALIDKIVHDNHGVDHTIRISGLSFLLGANGSHLGTMFVVLKPFEERREPGQSANEIVAQLQQRLARVEQARVFVFPPPPVRGLATAGGFKFMIEDRSSEGPAALQAQADNVIKVGTDEKSLGLEGLTTVFRANTPQMYVDIDRPKCKLLGVPLSDVFDALQVDLGGLYVNDYNQFGRTWQVNVQADIPYRMQRDDIRRLQVRNGRGDMVPLATVATVRDSLGPFVINRYNTWPAAAINGRPRPGVSSGQVIDAVERLRQAALAVDDLRMDRACLSANHCRQHYRVRLRRCRGAGVPGAGRPVRELVAAAGGDSGGADVHPLLGRRRGRGEDGHQHLHPDRLCGPGGPGEQERHPDRRVRQVEARGRADRAARPPLAACNLRLRPILMTSFAFIFGVIPLVISSGAGAEMRRTLGTAVFSGMLGVTLFGIFLTPVFYCVIQWLADKGKRIRSSE